MIDELKLEPVSEPAKRPGRRVLLFDRELLQRLLTEGNEIHDRVEIGLPADAELVTLTYDQWADRYYMVFQSATWERTPECEMLPHIFITWKRLGCADGGQIAEIGTPPDGF